LGTETDGNKYVLLHYLMGQEHLTKTLARFYERLLSVYPGRFFMPKTEKELETILLSFDA
jgi:hypothetical protein